MKNKKLFIFLLLCGLVLTLIPSFVFAAEYQCVCVSKGYEYYIEGNYPNITACEKPCMSYCLDTYKPMDSSTCKTVSSAKSPTPSAGGGQTTGKLTNPLGTTDVPTLIGKVIKAVLGVVGSIALLMFIYGGFLWLTSAGAEQKITKGKQVLVWAIIGLAIIFLSYAAVGFVISSLTKGAAGEGNPQSSTSGGCCSTAVTCFNVNSEAECKSTGAGSNKFSPGMKCNDVGGAMVCS